MIKNIVIGIVLVGLGMLLGYYAMPVKVTTTIEIQEKIVEKVVEKKVTSRDINKDKNVRIVEITRKDGTKVKTTEIIDKSKIASLSKTDTEINKEAKKETKSETVTEYSSNWKVNVLALPVRAGSMEGLSPTNLGIGVERRIIGPLSVGAFVLGDKSVGLSVGMGL